METLVLEKLSSISKLSGIPLWEIEIMSTEKQTINFSFNSTEEGYLESIKTQRLVPENPELEMNIFMAWNNLSHILIEKTTNYQDTLRELRETPHVGTARRVAFNKCLKYFDDLEMWYDLVLIAEELELSNSLFEKAISLCNSIEDLGCLYFKLKLKPFYYQKKLIIYKAIILCK